MAVGNLQFVIADSQRAAAAGRPLAAIAVGTEGTVEAERWAQKLARLVGMSLEHRTSS